VALSPQSNYTDWATTTCRRNLVPTFVDRGVSRRQRGGSPTVVNPNYLARSLYFFFQAAPHLSSRGWVEPVPGRLLLRKSDSAGNRIRDLWVCSQEFWPLGHRGEQIFMLRLWVHLTTTCPSHQSVSVCESLLVARQRFYDALQR
jgi:hypothetical protein